MAQEQGDKVEPAAVTPSDSTREAALKVSADLLINTSKLVQAWITRFIVVNVALFSAVGFLLNWHDTYRLVAVLTICGLGFVVTPLMIGVIRRQNEWGQKIQALVLGQQEALGVKVHPYPNEIEVRRYTVPFVVIMGVVIMLIWLGIAVMVVHRATMDGLL